MRNLLLSLTLLLTLPNGAMAQMYYSPGAIERLSPQVEAAQKVLQPEQFPIRVQPQPMIIYFMPEMPAAKQTLKQRMTAVVKKIPHLPAEAVRATKAGAKKAGAGAKKAGQKLFELNRKAKPGVELIDTGTVIGGALYFWGRVFGFIKG